MKNLRDILEDLYYSLEDLFLELRFRGRQAKKKREKRKQEHPEPPRRPSLPREDVRKYAAAAGALVVLVLVVTGIWRGIGAITAWNRSSGQKKQAELTETETETEFAFAERDITIGSTGCMLLHSPFITSYPDAEGNYDFSSIYKYITPYYSEPDFMTCEFEGALGGEEAGYSGYPMFRSPDVIIENIRDSGVDLQMLATNHIYDGLSAGFHRTMQVYEQKGIAYTGIRSSTAEKPYYIADIQGVTVGFINYVFETVGTGTNLNAIPLADGDGELVNSFKYDQLDAFYSEISGYIQDMRADGARFIIANMHWGTEYQLTESAYQDMMAQELCDLGVDAVIGGHPHCEQPIDVLQSSDGSRNMFCIYSVGNALSNQRKELLAGQMPEGHTEDGVVVTLTLHQDREGNVAITGVDLLPTWVYRFENNGSKYYILPLDDVDQLEELTGITGIAAEAEASRQRTMEELGPGLQKAKEIFETEAASSADETESES